MAVVIVVAHPHRMGMTDVIHVIVAGLGTIDIGTPYAFVGSLEGKNASQPG